MQKIIFVGTTEFGIPTLQILYSIFQIPLIITQPDKPASRKKILTPPPIKLWAVEHNIPVAQPERIKDLELRIKEMNPDILLVAAYGQIIPQAILDVPKYGAINIHASLLPKYRGATPIQTALLNGDKVTGITLIQMDAKMDHGPALAQKTITINNNDNFITLSTKLSELAADLVAKTLPDWFGGKISPKEQSHDQATFTKIFTRDDARIDWTQPPAAIARKIKALNPEPGAWTTFHGKSVKILAAELSPEGGIKITTLQPEGKKPMFWADFLNGLPMKTKPNFI